MCMSVCIKCGEIKKEPIAVCQSCHFDPSKSDIDKAKSLLLSDAIRFVDANWELNTDQLLDISCSIKDGYPYRFDESKIEEIIELAEMIDEIPASSHSKVLFLIIGFPELLLAILLIFVLFTFF